MSSQHSLDERSGQTQGQPSGAGIGRYVRDHARTLIVVATVFLIVASIGATTSYVKAPADALGPDHARPQDGTLARLTDYARSIDNPAAAPPTPDGKLLPDVNTMIEQLASRLETAP